MTNSDQAEVKTTAPDVAKNFAWMLETACEDFLLLQKMIQRKLLISSDDEMDSHRASARITMALAKSFIFHVVRARRICEHGAGYLSLERVERKKFLNSTGSVVPVRDINEHGLDANRDSEPSLYHHIEEEIMVDETALVILGEKKIFMGPLNLYEIYLPVEAMRQLAGFLALRQRTNS